MVLPQYGRYRKDLHDSTCITHFLAIDPKQQFHMACLRLHSLGPQLQQTYPAECNLIVEYIIVWYIIPLICKIKPFFIPYVYFTSLVLILRLVSGRWMGQIWMQKHAYSVLILILITMNTEYEFYCKSTLLFYIWSMNFWCIHPFNLCS